MVGQNYWTAEQDDVLRDGVLMGLSGSAIANLIRQQTGTLKTRNAVIGRVHRLKLAVKWGGMSHQSESARQAGKVRSAALRAKRMAARAKRMAAAAKKKKPKPPTSAARFHFGSGPNFQPEAWVPAAELETPAVLVGLDVWPPDKCKWPYGGDKPGEPIRFGCECERVTGLPYCRGHAERAYVPPQPRRRPAGGVSPVEITVPASGHVRGDNEASASESEETVA